VFGLITSHETHLTRWAYDIAVTDIGCGNHWAPMKELNPEILLSFWKVHVLRRAEETPLHGQWMLNELRHHGYPAGASAIAIGRCRGCGQR